MTTGGFRDHLAERATSAGVRVPPGIVDGLERYVRLLARWNSTINLTALPVDDPSEETLDRLVIEPLAAAPHVNEAWSPWWDIGSGGGSPAIPLKLVKSALALTMVESRDRKAAFLREVVRELQLPSSTVEAARFEDLAARNPTAMGLITLRGVRLHARLASAIRLGLRNGGHLLIFSSAPTHEPPSGFAIDTTVRLVHSLSGGSWLVNLVRTA